MIANYKRSATKKEIKEIQKTYWESLYSLAGVFATGFVGILIILLSITFLFFKYFFQNPDIELFSYIFIINALISFYVATSWMLELYQLSHAGIKKAYQEKFVNVISFKSKKVYQIEDPADFGEIFIFEIEDDKEERFVFFQDQSSYWIDDFPNQVIEIIQLPHTEILLAVNGLDKVMAEDQIHLVVINDYDEFYQKLFGENWGIPVKMFSKKELEHFLFNP